MNLSRLLLSIAVLATSNVKASEMLAHTVYEKLGAVTIKELPEASEFSKRLAFSIAQWKAENRRSVMVEIPVEKSPLVAVAAEQGFKIRPIPSQNKVSMGAWISQAKGDDVDMIPNGVTRTAGVAMLVEYDGKILVMTEKNNPKLGEKLPSGRVELGQRLIKAARRELLEELGIHAEAERMVCQWDRSCGEGKADDSYTVFTMRPLNTNITMQPSEVASARWADRNEVMANAKGTLRYFLAAAAAHGPFVQHVVPDISGKGTMVLYAPADADLGVAEL